MKIKPRETNHKANEIQAIILFGLALLILMCLVSFSFDDLARFTARPNVPVRNFAGLIGVYVGAALYIVMGISSYVIPLLILSWAVARLFGVTPQKVHFKIFGTFFLILASSSLFSIFARGDNSFRFGLGGIVGLVFSDFLIKYLGKGGAFLVIGVLFLLSLLLATEFLLLPFLARLFNNFRKVSEDLKGRAAEKKEPLKFTVKRPAIKIMPEPVKPAVNNVKPPAPKPVINIAPASAPSKPSTLEVAAAKDRAVPGVYTLPGLDILDAPPPVEARKIAEDFEGNARILEETLRDFDIESKVVEINRGPVITRYELEPAPGVKIHRITALSDNIALSMKAQSVRIVAPVPGKGTVGVEVPNSSSTLVFLREVLDTKEYRNFKSKYLKLALGKDIAGTPVVADLGTMPHLLVAGATGSGKTVCLNTIITSMLFNSTPEELKFIMIDPKRVELAVFNDLPHLLSPVVTDTKKVAATLEWVVGEMDSRFQLFATSGVRNIDLYNEKFGKDPKQKLPFIVIIIDELADLMMVAQQDVESTITRLAQLSRAVGIHMIIATQRPSVDVITGVIKANFPARISFKVASKVDSRTVMDMNGADKLLGRGDMLFIEPGASRPVRAQCSLISDKEIERITSFIKNQRSPEYIQDILELHKKPGAFKKFEKDEVYEEAVKLILETGQASVSVLQRRLGLGYTRAARLIDMMEDEGVVGPYQGSKPREILTTLEEYQAKSAV